jgi:hypothetical protein
MFPALGQWFSMMEGPDMMALGTSISGVFHVYEESCNGIRFLTTFAGTAVTKKKKKKKKFDNEHPVLRVIFDDPYHLQIFSRKTVLYGV